MNNKYLFFIFFIFCVFSSSAQVVENCDSCFNIASEITFLRGISKSAQKRQKLQIRIAEVSEAIAKLDLNKAKLEEKRIEEKTKPLVKNETSIIEKTE